MPIICPSTLKGNLKGNAPMIRYAGIDPATQYWIVGAARLHSTDPETGRRCYRSKTVRGNRLEAERELAAMVDNVGRGPGIVARTTVSQPPEQWFAIAATGWSPTGVEARP